MVLPLVFSLTKQTFRMARPSAPMALPLLVAASWVVFPALDDEFKIQLGLMKDPNPPQPAEPEVKLDSVGVKAATDAYKPQEHAPSKKTIQIREELQRGEFKTLEAEWERFTYKSMYSEDDDDDDDEEDEEEEEEEDE